MQSTQPIQYQSFFSKQAPDPRPSWDGARGKYDFAIAYPDPASIPIDGLLEAMHEALPVEGQDLALYTGIQGYPPLRKFVADKLARDRGIHVGPEGIFLTSGAGQAIHVILEMLLDPGDVVLTDDFTYSGALYQMRRFRADIRGVVTDHEGVLPDALADAIEQAVSQGKRPKLIYLVPTFQNPQGWTMSLERRLAVIKLAQQHGILILEDDCYGDLRFEGKDVPTIYSLDDGGHVLYVSTFSKTIGPGMRCGFMTAPRPLLEKAIHCKSGGPVPLFVTLAIHRYAVTHLASHIEQINDIQQQKRDAMLRGLADHFGEQVSWLKPEGGLSMWVKFPAGVDLTVMRDKILAEDSVGYTVGNGFSPDRIAGKNYMRLSFGFNTPDEIYEGMRLLAGGFRREGVLR